MSVSANDLAYVVITVAGDSDEEDYEEGMGDIDVENATPALQI